MAYSTIYRLPFYSPDGVTGLISIQKDGFTGDVSTLKLLDNGLKITCKMKDWFSPIIGQSCSLKILNDAPNFYGFLDLFTLEEREFKIIIDASDAAGNSVRLFDGFVNSDVVSQNYFKNSTVNLTASNYVSKLENTTIPTIDIIQRIAPINLHSEALSLIGKDASIYVNITIDPSIATSTDDSTALNRSAVDTEIFWKNNIEKADALESIETLLKPFDSYLYWWDDNWYVQRYTDIWTQDGSKLYCVYPPLTHDSPLGFGDTGYVRNVDEVSTNINDFDIVDRSQNISIIPGLNKIELKLNQRSYLNFTNNDFTYAVPNSTYVARTDPSARTWNYFDVPGQYWGYSWNVGKPWKKITNGIGRYGIPDASGLYTYEYGYVATKFNVTVSKQDTDLNIKWKGYPFGVTPTDNDFQLRYFLKKPDEGDYVYIVQDEPDSSLWAFVTSETQSDYQNTLIKSYTALDDTNMYEADVTVPLSDVIGMPDVSTDTALIFGLLVTRYGPTDDPSGYYLTMPSEYYGDVVITVSSDKQNNLLVAEINSKTLDKKEIQLDLFDADNLNIANGLYTNSDFTLRTSGWDASERSLTDLIINNKYQLYSKHRRKLTANIKHPGFLKPLSMYYDGADPDKKTYLLTNYNYYPLSDVYDCEWWEYNNADTININNAN